MELLKDRLALTAITELSQVIHSCLPSFDQQGFIKEASMDIEQLELKARVLHITKALQRFLPQPFIKFAALLPDITATWLAFRENNTDSPFSPFSPWPLIEYIGIYGLDEPDIAIPLLANVTELFTAEFAIRPFLINYPEKTAKHLQQWVKSENEHVRRLVSEGTRPRLPWGVQLNQFIAQPQANLPLLSALKYDDSLYVRRSIANHLNDIAKDHPSLVIDTCKSWLTAVSTEHHEAATKKMNIKWLVKHATRTLVKKGHMAVFPLLGYTEHPNVTVSEITLSSQSVYIGSDIQFSASIKSQSTENQSIVIDYAVHFIKNNGKQQAKMFKLKNVVLAPNETMTLQKKHALKIISTRKYYAGIHKIEIFVNGVAYQASSFNLLK